MNWLNAYPFATASTVGFYLFVFAFALPMTRPSLVELFGHPIPPHQKYLRGFDALRGLAAAFVAFAHCWWATYPIFAASQMAAPFVAYGSKGVPIFAVLSGFLIYRSSLLAVKSVAELRAYIIRRFFRIYPVYFLGIILCALMEQYVSNPNFSQLGYLVSDIFMLTTFNWPGGYANPPTWSLYIEVAFYAVLPLAIVAVGQKRMVALSAIMLAACVVADYPSRVFVLWRYFFVGIIASEAAPKLGFWVALSAFCAGVGLVVYDLGGPSNDWVGNFGIGHVHMDGSTLGLGLGCGLILASLPQLPAIGAVLNVLPLRVLGVISFSVYITHFFYIRANFPEITLFTLAGTQPMYEHFRQLPSFSGWYLPIIFFPGLLFWGGVSFLVVERPGMILGRSIVKRLFVRDPLDPVNADSRSKMTTGSGRV